MCVSCAHTSCAGVGGHFRWRFFFFLRFFFASQKGHSLHSSVGARIFFVRAGVIYVRFCKSSIDIMQKMTDCCCVVCSERERERESSHMCREEKKTFVGQISARYRGQGAVTGKKTRDASFYIKGECRECCILADFCFFCFFLLRLVSVAKKKMTVMVSLRKGCPTWEKLKRKKQRSIDFYDGKVRQTFFYKFKLKSQNCYLIQSRLDYPKPLRSEVSITRIIFFRGWTVIPNFYNTEKTILNPPP